MLDDIKSELENIIKAKEKIWKKHKVNRNLNNIEILLDIKNIIEERLIESFALDDLITYFNCESTNEYNKESIKKYREAIIKIIPKLCDAIDDYNHEEIYRIISNIIYVRPKKYHENMDHQLEKIYGCLNSDNDFDINLGLRQAEAFSKEFAKKWVIIEPYKIMSFDEIKMLTNVACYLEYKEQETNKKV